MASVTFSELVLAGFMVNFITVAFFYAVWRIRKNESDWTAITIALFCCLIVGVTAYAVAQPS